MKGKMEKAAKKIYVRIEIENMEEIQEKLKVLISELEKANSLTKELAAEPLIISLQQRD